MPATVIKAKCAPYLERGKPAAQTTQYEPEIYSLLFGEILGVSTSQILPIAASAPSASQR